jgi:hypothetical protein
MKAEYRQKLLSDPAELKRWMDKQNQSIRRGNIAVIILGSISICISIALITLQCLRL